MARLGDVFLDQNRTIAKARLALALRPLQRRAEIARLFDQPHALAAASRARLDQNRIADLLRLARQHIRILIRPVITRYDRHARRLHRRLGRVLQPHRPDRARRRADEHKTSRLDRFDKLGVFRQEPIARMDRLRPGRQRRLDDHIPAQITFGDRRRTDPHRLIGRRHMRRARIRIRIDRHCADAQLPGRGHHPQSDLAAIGYQDAVKHRVAPPWSRPWSVARAPTRYPGWLRSRSASSLSKG